jgi:hypothetical protein
LKKISPKRRRIMQYFLSEKTLRTMLVIFDGDDLLIEGLQEVVKRSRYILLPTVHKHLIEL